MKKILAATGISLSLALGAVAAYAAGASHPNLEKAQTLIQQAMIHIDDARKAHEYDMEGHANKAVRLLQQADKEISLADHAAKKSEKEDDKKGSGH
jgi:hypothetical protein